MVLFGQYHMDLFVPRSTILQNFIEISTYNYYRPIAEMSQS